MTEEKQLRSGFVTLVGRPNVGKSTLMNRLIGQKIAITSKKPQTTRNRILTVYTDPDRGQIIFLDTPGIHKAKNKLGEFMMSRAEQAFAEADVILWLVEPSEQIGAGDQHIAKLLRETGIPVILVVNKMDTCKNSNEVLAVIDSYRKAYDYFAEIVPVSALRGDNETELLDTLFSHLAKGPMYYDEDTVTDQPERAIVAELIREKALHALSDEIPHGIAVTIESMKEREKTAGKGQNGRSETLMDIEAVVICERDSHKGIIIGKGGAMIKKIGTNARYEIERLLNCHVNLSLRVKVKKDWRDSDVQLRNFGYTASE